MYHTAIRFWSSLSGSSVEILEPKFPNEKEDELIEEWNRICLRDDKEQILLKKNQRITIRVNYIRYTCILRN